MKPLFSILIAAATLLAIGRAPEAAAAAPNAEPQGPGEVSVDTVVVVGYRTARDIVPAQTLAGKELQRLGAVSVADAIRYFSGMQIKDYGGVGGLKTINIRSMGSHHVGVFYDGVQIGNAQNGQIDLGRFSMDNMESISLYNGQKSDIFQSAKDFASAGAIYMVSRRPVIAADRRRNLRVSVAGGSFGTVDPSVVWEERLSKSVDASLSAEWMHTTGRYPFRTRKQGGYDTTEMRRGADVGMLRVEAGLWGRLRRGEARGKIYFYTSERGYPGAVDRSQPGVLRNESRQWDRNCFAQGSVRQYFRRASLALNAKYSHDYLRYVPIPAEATAKEGEPSAPRIDNRYLQNEIYFSASGEVKATEWWRLSVAGDMQFNTLDANLEGFIYPRRLMTFGAVASAIEWRRVKFQASVLHTFVHDITRTADGAAADRNVWSPTVVATWQPLRHIDLSVRAFYKEVFRMPTLGDLYYTGVGSKHLVPEWARQFNAGVAYGKSFTRGALRRIEAQVDGYFNRVRDKIIAEPSRDLFRWTMKNLGLVHIRGIDAAAAIEFMAGKVAISGRVNYTWQRAQDFTDPVGAASEWSYYGHQIPYIPWHSGSAVAGVSWRGWDLRWSFIYTGERYEGSNNLAVNYMRPWYTHDATLSKVVRLGTRHPSELRLTAECNNIFNQAYEVVQCYPMPGMNFRLKISWTI